MSELSWKHKNNGLKRGDLRRAICCVTQDVHQKTMPNTWTFCTWSIEIWSGLGNVHHGSSGQDLKKERKKGTVNISELVPPYLARNNQPLGLMHSSALSQWKPVADHKFVKFGPLVPFLACFKSKACFKSEEESIHRYQPCTIDSISKQQFVCICQIWVLQRWLKSFPCFRAVWAKASPIKVTLGLLEATRPGWSKKMLNLFH